MVSGHHDFLLPHPPSPPTFVCVFVISVRGSSCTAERSMRDGGDSSGTESNSPSYITRGWKKNCWSSCHARSSSGHTHTNKKKKKESRTSICTQSQAMSARGESESVSEGGRAMAGPCAVAAAAAVVSPCSRTSVTHPLVPGETAPTPRTQEPENGTYVRSRSTEKRG